MSAPAFPSVTPNSPGVEVCHGITKRELFAAMAMQGLLPTSHINSRLEVEIVVGRAVTLADALIAELEKLK